ncbi:hypothetical protein GQ600_8099 [Phytophthora cactorum]|nr:hypothetical protein GQ600_8099 [Phytophthora cactorum]
MVLECRRPIFTGCWEYMDFTWYQWFLILRTFSLRSKKLLNDGKIPNESENQVSSIPDETLLRESACDKLLFVCHYLLSMVLG